LELTYIRFHPLAYIIKLNIEMSMADLIVEIASKSQSQISSHGTINTRPRTPEVFKSSIDQREIPLEDSARTFSFSKTKYPKSTTQISGERVSGSSQMSDGYTRKGSSDSTSELFTANEDTNPSAGLAVGNKMEVNMQQEVHISVEDMGNNQETSESPRSEYSDDGTLLRVAGERVSTVDRCEAASRLGLKQGMGVHTSVWAPK
jgi:hypothetical protein